MWRGLEESNTAFFVLEVDSVEKVGAFLNPEAVAVAYGTGKIPADPLCLVGHHTSPAKKKRSLVSK